MIQELKLTKEQKNTLVRSGLNNEMSLTVMEREEIIIITSIYLLL
jgi:hypothetical protein